MFHSLLLICRLYPPSFMKRFLTLDMHAQRGFLSHLVCLCVCLSVNAYSGTTGYEAAYELYKRVQIYEGLNKKGDSLETTVFGRYGVKTSEKPIC